MTDDRLMTNPIMRGGDSPHEMQAARTWLSSMRRGDCPTSEEAAQLHQAAVIGSLRKLVEPSDLSWLLPLIKSSDEKLAGLSISILASHSRNPQVQESLQEAWQVSSPHLQSVIMWRLLDDPDLPHDWQERLFQFVLAEPTVFHANCLRFFGGTEESLIAFVLERVSSAHIAESKKWAYLCAVSGVENYPGAAAVIIRMGLNSDNEFTTRVAKQLLEDKDSA